jgi:maltose alpha-D-glucosyltransferase/alpha-amylase
MTDPTWYQNAVFYELYVRAFCDSNGDGHGDLRGLLQKLDYLQELGVDCIWLLPIYPSPLLDDGYDVADFCAIHPDYGSLDDFKALVSAAHQRGLRIITDLVPNHTSDQHSWFQEARASRHAARRDFYVWSDTDQKYADARIIFVDTEPSNWTLEPNTRQYYWHRFFSHQPDLNYDNPEVQQAMLDVVKFWLELGVDGFRADAVPYLYEREGTSCENLPETHAYLKRLRAYMDGHYPGRILLSEANQWPGDTRAYFGDGDEFNLAFHFPLMPRIFMALARGDCQPILDILANTPAIPDNCQWCTFLRCHDELTLEMVTPEERDFMWEFYAPEPRMRLNLGIRRRLAPLLGNDRRRIELANCILFTLPGTPTLYYGDEIGMGDDIFLDDRNGVRTPMQWSAAHNAGFSDAPASRLYSTVIDDPVFGHERVNVADQRAEPSSLFHTIRKMIRLRKEHPSLGAGGFQAVPSNNPAVLAYLRPHAEETMLAVHNLTASLQAVQLDLEPLTCEAPTDVIAGSVLPAIGGARYALRLEPYQSLWLQVHQKAGRPKAVA